MPIVVASTSLLTKSPFAAGGGSGPPARRKAAATTPSVPPRRRGSPSSPPQPIMTGRSKNEVDRRRLVENDITATDAAAPDSDVLAGWLHVLRGRRRPGRQRDSRLRPGTRLHHPLGHELPQPGGSGRPRGLRLGSRVGSRAGPPLPLDAVGLAGADPGPTGLAPPLPRPPARPGGIPRPRPASLPLTPPSLSDDQHGPVGREHSSAGIDRPGVDGRGSPSRWPTRCHRSGRRTPTLAH